MYTPDTPGPLGGFGMSVNMTERDVRYYRPTDINTLCNICKNVIGIAWVSPNDVCPKNS